MHFARDLRPRGVINLFQILLTLKQLLVDIKRPSRSRHTNGLQWPRLVVISKTRVLSPPASTADISTSSYQPEKCTRVVDPWQAVKPWCKNARGQPLLSQYLLYQVVATFAKPLARPSFPKNLRTESLVRSLLRPVVATCRYESRGTTSIWPTPSPPRAREKDPTIATSCGLPTPLLILNPNILNTQTHFLSFPF